MFKSKEYGRCNCIYKCQILCMHACTYLWTLTADDSMKNVKKKIWENAELKVKKYVPVHADLSLTMNI